jgi:hypothetical protein
MYSVVYGEAWDGETARSCRGDAALMIVYFYLMTTNHANMIGVFGLPPSYVRHHTGLPESEIERAFDHFEQEGFIQRDRKCDWVFVRRMAEIRLRLAERDEPLSPKDNRLAGVQALYRAIPSDRLAAAFYDTYKEPLRLKPRITKPTLVKGGGARASDPIHGTGRTPHKGP